MAAAQVRIHSKCTIRPSPRPNEENGGRIIHLTPWDLMLVPVDYIQKGILFRRPNTPQQDEEHMGRGDDLIISALRTSFAATLDHFFPFAGRLAVLKHDDGTSPRPSLSISLECNDQGADFIHASATTVTVSDILDSLYIPPVVLSFFPLNGALSYDGHRLPLLAVQVTQLADGMFIGCSLNHSAGDGTCFWNFFNSWSEICRTGSNRLGDPPVIDRWFVDSSKPPIRLPFSSERDFISRPVYAVVEECAFHFSGESVAKLKSRANAETGAGVQISSLQSLLAHLWLSVTRARRLHPQQETSYSLLVGCRTRLTPPLPQNYLGNSVYKAETTPVSAGELLQRGLGWAAWLLNQSVDSYKESVVRKKLEEWPTTPFFASVEHFKPGDLVTGSSPRFNVYGNDFGWGKPVAVRSGCGNKIDGKATVYPGPERGSMTLEVSLSANALALLINDEEFMEMVSNDA